jgi:hypothetical protein
MPDIIWKGTTQPNFGGIVFGWPPSKIVSGDPDFQSRWPPIPPKFGCNWLSGFWGEDFYVNFP